MVDPASRRYVDRSISGHAVVTEAGKPSVGRCLAGSATGQLQPFAQRQIVASGLVTPFPVASGIGVGIVGGLGAMTILPFPFPLVAAAFVFGLVLVGHRAVDALSVRWRSPDMTNGDRALNEYAQMASAEVRRKERDREADAELGVRRRSDRSQLFPHRTVWAMRESGNGVAQFAAQKLISGQFTPDATDVADMFERCRYEAWEVCTETCGDSGAGVLAVEGAAHAVFGGALAELSDEDLLGLAPLVVERREVESRVVELTGKIERAEQAGADSDYPEVAGASVEVAVLCERVDRIEAIYQDRLTVAQDEAELSRLTKSEKEKADWQEQALRDLSYPPRDDD